MRKLLILIGCCISMNSISQNFAGGGRHTFAICIDSTVMSWGSNVVGQLGDGSNTDSNIPVIVSNLNSMVKVAEGCEDHSMALKNDGTVWTWGYNMYGQLGNGNNTDSNLPQQISSFNGVVEISGGYGHSIALKNDGTVWTWGYNQQGQLGHGNNGNLSIPTELTSITNIIKIAGRQYHTIALKSDGTVWTWGYNAQGQLGNGNNANTNVPIQVTSLSGIIEIAAGWGHTIALKNDGTVWAWGQNLEGQLGNGFNLNTNTPVQVSSLTGIIDIAGGVSFSIALKNDGTVWAWGKNNYGQLGDGTNLDSNIPLEIPSLSNMTAITSGGDYHAASLKNDGTLWTWGINTFGQLGNGNNTDSNIPIQVTGLCELAVKTELTINESELLNSFSVYPNPTNEYIKIEYLLGLENNYQVSLYDISGVEVMNKKIYNGSIDVSSLSSGSYIMKIEVEGNVVHKMVQVMK